MLSATTFNKQARTLLDTRTEHLRESVTRSPLSHITGRPATACQGRIGVARPRAPLVEQVGARGGSECNDLQQAG